ncbi:MAG: DEAD/DEAH box helicase [Euzebya sp.]
MIENKTFADFGVDATICDSLAEVGITSPFPIQEMTLPLALNGADIIGQARTGTGKTLGFGLPLLQRIDINGGLQSLVIVPTRELCLQVAEDLAQAGKGRGVDVVAVYGGKALQPQIDAIAAGAHLVVGTPGRLLDLSRRGVMNLSGCHGLVLDEADEMLDLGFLPDVEALIEMCAAERQTLLFSATMPAQIVGLARKYMTKPTFMRAEVEEITIAPETKQYFLNCHRMDKPAVLARILTTPGRGLCVVFCRTKRMADTLAEELRDRDVAAQAIHSDLRQEARERALQKFRDGKITVLCATEVAARGLDIADVTHVVNYDCPDDDKMYLHRIGRTGRAGGDGVAITFAVWNELPRLEMIRRDLDITEEIHEVFSTSPLLEELFDLPVQEERKKVPSPPQARSGKGSRSQARGKKAEERSVRSEVSAPHTTPDLRRRRRSRTSVEEVAPVQTSSPSPDKATVQTPSTQRPTRERRRSKTVSPDAGTKVETGTRERAQATRPAESSPRPKNNGKRSAERPKTKRPESVRGESARGESARSGRSRRRGEPSGGDRDRTRGPRKAVDADQARGQGQPRLNRPLDVAHLP